MNRGYSYTPKGQAHSPPRRDRSQTQSTSRISSFSHQAHVKQDINIDDFGDMGSDEDDLQALGSNFMPPKPPAQPQYNLVPYGFLRDDDELAEEDYDGVPIDDTVLQDSPKKLPWESSPCKPQPEEIRGESIDVLGSGNRHDSYLSKWPNDIKSQDAASRNRPGLGSTSVDRRAGRWGKKGGLGSSSVDRGAGRWDKKGGLGSSSVDRGAGNRDKKGGLGSSSVDVGAGRWDKKGEPLSKTNAGSNKNIPSLMGIDHNLGKASSFVRGNDDSNLFLTSNKSAAGNTMSFARSNDDSNPFIKGFSKQTLSGNATSFVSAKDTSSSTSLRSHENTPRWNDKPKPVRSSTPSWAEQDRGFSQRLKGQVQPGQNQMFTPTSVANTSSQLGIIQAAALQQALAGLTQLGSHSGLNLLGAQNLLMQASQNPTLAAALVASGGMLNTGLSSIQPHTSNNPTIEALLKSAVTTAVPDVPQSNLGLLTYPLRSNIKGNSGSTPRKNTIPDGSGSTRYPAPDVSSLVFDPSNGYRFDASTGLHYDANSGYFFNSELKIYLRWDKFTQTYLKVDNPPGVPRFKDSSIERISFKDSPLASQDKGQHSSSLPNTPFLKESIRTSNTFSTNSFAKENRHGLNPLMSVPTSSLQEEINTVHPSMNTIHTDLSKPPPPLSHTLHSDSGFQQAKANPPSAAEQKVAALPNYAETSLFNKLRKAKLAQTAQAKFDRKQWGSPDPLLEAAEKRQAGETNKSLGDALNLKEILQRSRQFVKQKIGNALDAGDDTTDRQTGKGRSHCGNRRKVRSRSRSVGRPLRRSRSSEKSGNRRGRSSMSPQQRRPLVRSPESRRKPDSRGRSPNRSHKRPSLSPGRNMMPASSSKSPNNKSRGRASLSPAPKRRRSVSRGRSPIKRARGRASPSPEARKRRPASGARSPLRRMGKSSKSPDPRQGIPISRGRSPKRKSRGRRSISQEPRKRRLHSRTPDHSLLKRSQSPKVKVVLDLSPGGSKIQVHSPGRNNKKSAERELSAERRTVRCKLSPSNVKASVGSPERLEASVEDKTGLAGRKPMRERLGIRVNRNENLEKDRITELKPIPYDTPQSSNKKPSIKGKDVSGYKSLSNLRNLRNKRREKETMRIQDNSHHNKDKSATSRMSTEVDLAVDSDDEKRNRANHRLVSERTFSSGWERNKPSMVSEKLSNKKTETTVESPLGARDTTKDIIDNKDRNMRDESEEDVLQLEEPNEFDFLNETLDDDKESTVIDEYEEILDYQDLDETTELLENESASIQTKPGIPVARGPLSKESTGSPVIDLCIDPEEPAVQASTSESHLERKQCSSEDSEPVEIPSGKLGTLGNRAAVAQGKEDANIHKDKELMDEYIDGAESRDLEVVNDILDDSAKVHDQSLKNHSAGGKEMKKPHTPVVGICKKGVSRKSVDLPTVQGVTSEVRPESKEDVEKSNKVDKAAAEMKDAPNDKVDYSESDRHAPDEIGPESLANEDWNVVDSVDGREEVTKQTISTDVKEFPHSDEQDLSKLDLVVTNDSPTKLGTNLESQKVYVRNDVTQNAIGTKIKDDALYSRVREDEFNLQASVDDAKNDEIGKADRNNEKPDTQVSKEDGRKAKPALQGSDDDGLSKQITSQSELEEPLLQVRSVSDIEKFLLLSSQEVEAKREQGIEPTTSKNEKKSGVFSRLGEKLPTSEAGGEPKVVLELASEISVLSAGPSNKVSVSTPSEVKSGSAKLSGASNTTKKSKEADPNDPVGSLFIDKPTSQILIGPLNFIEPLPNFQQFTRKYMQHLLKQEGVKFRKIHVCHEDVTGAPYHYILVMFHSIKLASDWFKKHKGRFKCNEKLFTQIPGHTKHKLIAGTEAFLHFTDNNWLCKVCKKWNFPPRSLCFGCFQHKDPEGFSPLTILDKGPLLRKQSNFVGTPKLKFFVTKERVIDSAPPLDGFDIKNIEMIMDEKMGFPAGICVFEMSNIIDAGKLKKYLNHREVEAVSVEMHEPDSTKTSPPIVPSRKTPPKESRDEHLHKSLQAASIYESDTHDRRGYQGGRGTRELSPTIPSREERVPRGHSPSPSRESRVPRGRSLSPSREVRVSRGRSLSPSHEIRVPRGRSPSPSRQVRVPWVRSPSPFLSRLSRDRVRSRSPRHHSSGHQPRSRSPRYVSQLYEENLYSSTESRSAREISRGRTVREVSPRYRSRERSPVPYGFHQSPPRHRSRSPVYNTPRRRSPSPRYLSLSPVRPTKPDGRGDWRYPPPDPTNFRFEPRSGLDYDPTTTLYYEPKSCCFYNDDINEWLEYDPRSGRYVLVR